MYSLLFLGLVSFVLSFVLTPLIKYVAWHFGIIDLPDQKRKIHCAPVPRLGGAAIFAAVIGAYGILLVVRFSSGAIVWEGLPLVLRLLPALVVVFGTGLIDDIFSLSPRKKLIFEVLAAILAWFGGIHISGLEGVSFFGVVVNFICTILWIITCANAINLIDGVDGLAVGVSLFAAFTMLLGAMLNHNFPMALAIVPLVGALLGFLRYNFSPAKIFLGDCGSLTLGFLLGCYGVLWSEKSATLLGMMAPLLVLAVPLLDVGLAVARRFLRGQPIFRADRDHIHHKLLSKGFTPRRLVLVIYCVCGISAATSLLLIFSAENNRGFVIVLVCLALWLGLQHLGYKEFGAARKIVFGGVFGSVLSAQLALEVFESELSADISLQQCSDLFFRACPEFGFSGAVFHIDDVRCQWGSSDGWQARLDFPGHGYINIWREFDDKNRWAVVVVFVDGVSRAFNKRLNQMETVLYD